MIITFYTPTLKLSGGNLVMFEYAKFLAQHNIKVYVISPDKCTNEYEQDGIIIRTFKKFPNKYFEHLFFQLIYIKQFYDLTPQSDIIIPIFFPLIIHAIFSKIKGKGLKIISLFQDFKEMFWFGKYIFFLLGIKSITKHIDKFISVSTPISDEIRKKNNTPVYTVPNGINKAIFYPRKNGKENYVLFIGSSKTKGIKEFLKAFETISREYPNIKAKIVGPNVCNNNNNNIEFLGTIKDKNIIAELYSKALVFVSQSYGDSFGLPPLEAMSCGTAVILTDTLGAKEYAINNINSIIVPIKNVNATINAMREIIQNSSFRIKLEQEGYNTALNYNLETSKNNFYKYVVTESTIDDD